MADFKKTIKNLVAKKNSKQKFFTAGPASLIYENIINLESCFGRGDDKYLEIENKVLANLMKISSHEGIVRMQGSGSLAIEVMMRNYLFGNLLIIDTGFYSKRLELIAKLIKTSQKSIKKITTIGWNEISSINQKFDWIVCCYVDTSRGLKLPAEILYSLSKRTKSKIMLDATASIGLEENHDIASVISYSSCKGLFGLTGASFIAYNELPQIEVDSFYLNFTNHLEKKMTGPYHIIQSLDLALKNASALKYSVFTNKKIFQKRFNNYLVYETMHQPKICTYVNVSIVAKEKNVILYEPRDLNNGSIVCHLGEAHLGRLSKGKILNSIIIKK